MGGEKGEEGGREERVRGGMGRIEGGGGGGKLEGKIEVNEKVEEGRRARGGEDLEEMIMVLVLRPQGLFGAQLRERI